MPFGQHVSAAYLEMYHPMCGLTHTHIREATFAATSGGAGMTPLLAFCDGADLLEVGMIERVGVMDLDGLAISALNSDQTRDEVLEARVIPARRSVSFADKVTIRRCVFLSPDCAPYGVRKVFCQTESAQRRLSLSHLCAAKIPAYNHGSLLS